MEQCAAPGSSLPTGGEGCFDLHCSSVADAHEIPAVEIRPEMISHMVSRPFALRGSVFVVLKCNR